MPVMLFSVGVSVILVFAPSLMVAAMTDLVELTAHPAGYFPQHYLHCLRAASLVFTISTGRNVGLVLFL